MLEGIIPIVIVPFDDDGEIDETGLRRVVRFELEGGVDGIGVNGFASEAWKMSEDERRRVAAIVADEVAGHVPLVIGIAPGSTGLAIRQARDFAHHRPAALMTLPPATMKLEEQALIEHYVTLAEAADAPVMVQQAPQIQGYADATLGVESLAAIAARSENVCYFKLEGPGAAERIAALRPLLDSARVRLFGGGGGITLPDELRAGSSGLIPGVGFNDVFCAAWPLWRANQHGEAIRLLDRIQPLVSAVSGPGHEFSLHARKHLLRRAGLIRCAHVRRPTVEVKATQLEAVATLADRLALRISCPG